MLKIDFTQEAVEKLHYERYHHPHPLVQRKMEVLYLKSQGIKHKEICNLYKITKTTLTKYIRQYQLGGVEELKKLSYKGQPSELNQHSDILKEYFEKHPASSVAEASDAIEKLTGVKRSPTQVREFLSLLNSEGIRIGGGSKQQKWTQKQKALDAYLYSPQNEYRRTNPCPTPSETH